MRADHNSSLLSLIVSLKLPALKAHQHTAKLVPADFLPIDNEKWHAAIAASSHSTRPRTTRSSEICSLCSPSVRCFVDKARRIDQSPEQNKQVFLRISDDLEVVPSGVSVAKLEGVERHSGAEQLGSKVKLVDFSS